MTIAPTMTFHPRPEPGEATPWAFPAPVRSTLPNGLTVLRCDRPGQKLVAVDLLLDAPLSAEPAGLDGVATILARSFSEGTESLTAEEFAGELERAGATLDAHADHTSLRLSLEVPASRLERGLTLLEKCRKHAMALERRLAACLSPQAQATVRHWLARIATDLQE